MELNYDEAQHLDAEALAENGIAEAYSKLLPSLKEYVKIPAQIEEIIDADLPRYAIRVNDQTLDVYGPDTEGGDSWGVASAVLFKIVNDQLVNASVRLYAINGGNDLHGIFLTAEQALLARDSLPRALDWPYIPDVNPPWFGQHH